MAVSVGSPNPLQVHDGRCGEPQLTERAEVAEQLGAARLCRGVRGRGIILPRERQPPHRHDGEERTVFEGVLRLPRLRFLWTVRIGRELRASLLYDVRQLVCEQA